jgi:obscurin-like protein 1
MNCIIKNELKPIELTFKWKKNGIPLDIDENKEKYSFTIEDDKYCLKINNFTEKDEANYEIYLAHPEDWDVSSDAKIEVIPGKGDHEEVIEETTVSKEFLDNEEIQEEIEKKAKFVYKLDDCHVRKHDKGLFELKLPNREKVKWLKDGKPITASSKYDISQIGKVCTLFILDASLDDEGKYTAIIEKNEVSAQMTVQDFVEIISPLKDQTLTEKENLKLSVVISDKTEPGTWFKDGKPVELTPDITIESLNGKHELTIKNCKLNDGGVYTFVAKDGKSTANVNVNEEPLQIIKRLQDQDGLENTQVVFECELNKPNVPIVWLFNDLPLKTCFAPDTYSVTQIDNKHILTLPKCHLNQQGVFSLDIPSNLKLKTKAMLVVDEAPAEFLSKIEDITINEDENAEFMCQVSKPDVKVKWSLNNERLVAGENIKFRSDGDKRILKLSKCQLSDNGSVKCILPGEKSSEAKLTVLEVPVKIEMISLEVLEKEDAKFEAVLSKEFSKRDATWLFNSAKLSDSLKYSQDCDRDMIKHRLVIKDCTLEDAGEYTIYVRNDKLTVKLVVKELPCQFVKPLTDQNLLERTNATFDVTLTKPNNHTLKWYLNGVLLCENERFSLVQNGPKFSLNINDVLLSDAGQLKCVILNDKGEVVNECECKLNVKEIPLEIEKGLPNVKCMEKEEARFECTLNKEVNPDDIVWVKDGVKIKNGDENGRFQIINDGLKQILVVKQAHPDDTGSFEIRIKNVKSLGKLQVKEEPVTFVRELKESYTGTEKENLSLECEVSKDNIKCVWKKYGKVIEPVEGKIKIESNGRIQKFTLANLAMEDKQSISCVAIRGRKEDDELAVTNTKIIIKEGPLAIVKCLDNLRVNEGNEAILSVELTKPNEEVEWFKDGVKIRSDPKNRIYSQNNVYFLRINECDPKLNAGSYSFKVKDLETSGRLDIDEKPIKVVSGLNDKICNEDQTVKFEIELNKPDLQDRLVWLRNGKEIDLNADAFELKAIGPKYALIIKKAKFDDEGEYTVKIKDSDVSSKAKLSVEEAPLEFVRQLSDLELKENKTAEFECELNKSDEKVS